MIRRSARTPDTARIGQALARPGLDTRQWIRRAWIVEVIVDPAHGVFAEISFGKASADEPDERATARVATIYAGPGFGIYTGLEADDEVDVYAPGGDPAAGWVILPRLWSASDTPPTELGATVGPPPASLGLLVRLKAGTRMEVVAEDADVRIQVTGTGKVVIDAPIVELGGEGLNAVLDGVVHGRGIDSFTGATYAALGSTSTGVRALK